jgi:hypothetical protein
MPLWVGPDAIAVEVQSANGVMSESKTFTFTAPAALSSTTSTAGVAPISGQTNQVHHDKTHDKTEKTEKTGKK